MHYFEDVDGNFVQQFQSDGFDAGINPANPLNRRQRHDTSRFVFINLTKHSG